MAPCNPYRKSVNLQSITIIHCLYYPVYRKNEKEVVKINTLHFLQVYTAMLYRSSLTNLSRRRVEDSLSAISSSEAIIPDPSRLWRSSARPNHMSAWASKSDSSSIYWLPALELPVSTEISSTSLLLSEPLDKSVLLTSFLSRFFA